MRKALVEWLKLYADDLLTVAGIGVLVYATYRLHPLAGLYAVGAALLLLGYLVARATRGEVK